MSLSLKTGVKLRGLTPEMLLGIIVVEGAYADMEYDTIITSACDGRHSRGSLHYVGLAVDFRTRHLKAGDASKVAGKIKDRLGLEYDVVLERDHVHLEYQPERG